MKKLFFAATIALCTSAHAQEMDSVSSKKLYVKANALFLPVGVLNAGLEYQLSKKMTFQAEIFVSPWKSFLGKYAQAYMIGFDGRYYFDEAFKHWYLGGSVGFLRYKLQKWNYWSNDPYQYTETSPVYATSDLYQDGFSFMFGAVAGYQFQLSQNWNMDLFVGGGTAQSYYKGYHKELGIRYDTDPTREYNQSGEWLPYRIGVMLAYKLK